MTRRRRLLPKIALVPASVLVALLAAEVVLRLADHEPELRQGWYLTSDHRVPDDDVIMIRPEFRGFG